MRWPGFRSLSKSSTAEHCVSFELDRHHRTTRKHEARRQEREEALAEQAQLDKEVVGSWRPEVTSEGTHLARVSCRVSSTPPSMRRRRGSGDSGRPSGGSWTLP